MVDVSKGTAAAGKWDWWAEEKSAEIQGISLEVCVFSFGWNLFTCCNLQWAMVQENTILLGRSWGSGLARPKIQVRALVPLKVMFFMAWVYTQIFASVPSLLNLTPSFRILLLGFLLFFVCFTFLGWGKGRCWWLTMWYHFYVCLVYLCMVEKLLPFPRFKRSVDLFCNLGRNWRRCICMLVGSTHIPYLLLFFGKQGGLTLASQWAIMLQLLFSLSCPIYSGVFLWRWAFCFFRKISIHFCKLVV